MMDRSGSAGPRRRAHHLPALRSLGQRAAGPAAHAPRGPARSPARRGQAHHPPDVAGARVSDRGGRPAEPVLRRRLRLRQIAGGDDDRRWPRPEDVRTAAADGGVDGTRTRSITRRTSPGCSSSRTKSDSRATRLPNARGAPSRPGAGRPSWPASLRCRRCGRMRQVTYGGRGIPQPRYTCRTGNAMHGSPTPCISAGARRPDAAIAKEILLAVQPVAVEAAFVAERDAAQQVDERRQALELARQHAEYEVKPAIRRYEAADPQTNELVVAELEARWNAALLRLRECEERLAASAGPPAPKVTRESLLTLADDLEAAWHAPTTDRRTRQVSSGAHRGNRRGRR
jgi:hypothetical protein